jgi:hypothetical protein
MKTGVLNLHSVGMALAATIIVAKAIPTKPFGHTLLITARVLTRQWR